jgi:hypothetical protein
MEQLIKHDFTERCKNSVGSIYIYIYIFGIQVDITESRVEETVDILHGMIRRTQRKVEISTTKFQ